MNSLQLKKSSSSDLQTMKKKHLSELSRPQDAYWEQALIGLADHYVIQTKNQDTIGYYCQNSDHQIVDFYLEDSIKNQSSSILGFIIDHQKISSCLAGSNDSVFFTSALQRSKSQTISTLLFQNSNELLASSALFADHTFSLASINDFEEVMEIYVAVSDATDQQSIDGVYGSMKGYAEDLIRNQQLFMLKNSQGRLVAISERRISSSQKPYADIGMIVSPSFRRQGYGSFILQKTKQLCQTEGTLPICSCESNNEGSRKAIENAGFFCNHKIFQFQFS